MLLYYTLDYLWEITLFKYVNLLFNVFNGVIWCEGSLKLLYYLSAVNYIVYIMYRYTGFGFASSLHCLVVGQGGGL